MTTIDLPRIAHTSDLRTFLNNSPRLRTPNYFFSAGAMRAFSSRVDARIYLDKSHQANANSDDQGGSFYAYFVTSEQFVNSDGTAEPRGFNVRHVSIERVNGAPALFDAEVDTIGWPLPTMSLAKAYAAKLATGKYSVADLWPEGDDSELV